MPNEVLIEGYTLEELLDLPDTLLSAYLLTNEPIVFKAGSAEILGSFQLVGTRLVIELAQIDGGGEGVLLSLGILATRYAHQRQLQSIEWIIHALTCAKPNLKLQRILQRRGFVIEHVEGKGDCYHLIQETHSPS